MGLLDFIKINIRMNKNRRFIKKEFPNVYYAIDELNKSISKKEADFLQINYNKKRKKKSKFKFFNKINHITNFEDVDSEMLSSKRNSVIYKKDEIYRDIQSLNKAFLTALKIKDKNDLKNIMSLFNSKIDFENISNILNILSDDELIFIMTESSDSEIVEKNILQLTVDLTESMINIKSNNSLGKKLTKQEEFNSYLSGLKTDKSSPSSSKKEQGEDVKTDEYSIHASKDITDSSGNTIHSKNSIVETMSKEEIEEKISSGDEVFKEIIDSFNK